MNRREFFKSSALAGGAVLSLQPVIAQAADGPAVISAPRGASTTAALLNRTLPDLKPARWIWFPSGRVLQNTFVLFRRTLSLSAPPRRATGWIGADSRYRLEVNGRRLQWGPAPSDPRWAEADPIDLTAALQAGDNVLGATVLYYGVGDGTWPIGNPGFLLRLEIEHADGRTEIIASDASWLTLLCRAWPPGHYKRWFLRALQEEFDARLYPHGWTTSVFRPDDQWLPAMVLPGSPNQPALAAGLPDYQMEIGRGPAEAALRPRSIPLLRESIVPAKRLAESAWLEWRRSPQEYFESRTPGAFREVHTPSASEISAVEWRVQLDGRRGAVLTFEFEEQIVGWPFFTVEALEGTVVELLVHEAHQPGGPVLINSHFDAWSRFICRAGENHFETFDFESLRWLQLHLRGVAGEVRVRHVGVRRRVFPWPNPPQVRLGEPALQRLMEASLNTLDNCAQETLVDGMGRERQQYSGDGAHQMHAIYFAFGETRLPARYLTTFSQGLTLDGYFLDCWPAYDRLARLIERQLQLTGWGPILDHGIGFNFDCWHHYLYTGDREAVREPYPRLLRFADYLRSLVGRDGLLPVESLGIPSVWLDHVAYQKQRHKQCAFNLYASAALEHALAPLCTAFGETERAEASRDFARGLLRATVKHFWNPRRGLFVNNLPWATAEKQERLCDRSLATAILFDQCPRGQTGASLKALAECPSDLGFSYPANAAWRLWALGKGGRGDVILKDLRERWATMASVKLNNTLQEDWQTMPDSGAQWSHCALAPLFVLFMNIAGLRPLLPGFARCEIRPQLGDLSDLTLSAQTVRGPIQFAAQGKLGARTLTISTPRDCESELLVRREEDLQLKPVEGANPAGLLRYRLPPGERTELRLKFT